MNDIEDRAYRKSLKMCNPNSCAVPTTRELLVEMATEQKEIDIENIKEAIREVLQEEIFVSDISDSNDVDYIIGSANFRSFEWIDRAYQYKYELINDLINNIIKKIEE